MRAQWAVLIALAVSSVALLWFHQNVVDVAEYRRYERLIDRTLMADDALGLAVLRTRFGATQNYDRVVEAATELETAAGQLLEIPQYLSGDGWQIVRDRAEAAQLEIRRRFDVLERFKTNHSGTANSMHQLERYVRSVADQTGASSTSLSPESVALVALIISDEGAIASDQASDRARDAASLHLPDSLQPHYRNLTAKKSLLDDLVATLSDPSSRTASRLLSQSFHAQHDLAAEWAGVIGILLYANAALLAFFGVGLLHTLEHRNHKLRKLADGLDETVRRRTHQLEATAIELDQKAVQLERANRDLLRSNEELDEFAYIASHDLKEPLRGIANYVTMLEEDYADQFDEGGRDRIEKIRGLAVRMGDLIGSLFEYSRLGRQELAIESVAVGEIVGDVIQNLEFMIRDRSVDIQVDPGLPEVICDRVRIGEVFLNLITNAIKYNDQTRPCVEIGVLESSDGELEFFVRDNGIGIRERHLESVFRIFRRLHARDAYGGGTGAGITIVSKIIERHGGRIRLESTFGEGSCFFFTLGALELPKLEDAAETRGESQ